jgi:hypothetical protein
VSFDQRRCYEKPDRVVVEQAAAHLRRQAILGGYAGLEHKALAFGLALILDEARFPRAPTGAQPLGSGTWRTSRSDTASRSTGPTGR